jgi:hypothetical protein
MTRSNVRTLPLALALMFSWVFRADRCLGREISNVWNTWYPPVVEPVAPQPGGADTVVVENPYGISTCHYLPDASYYAIMFAIFAFISLFIGYLCAWNFQQCAQMRAAAIAFGTALPALLFAVLVYVPRHFVYFGYEEIIGLMVNVVVLLLLVCAAGALAWLAATLTLRWRPRG